MSKYNLLINETDVNYDTNYGTLEPVMYKFKINYHIVTETGENCETMLSIYTIYDNMLLSEFMEEVTSFWLRKYRYNAYTNFISWNFGEEVDKKIDILTWIKKHGHISNENIVDYVIDANVIVSKTQLILI